MANSQQYFGLRSASRVTIRHENRSDDIRQLHKHNEYGGNMLKAGNKKVLNYGPGRKSNVGRSIIRGTDQRKFYGDRRVHYYSYYHRHYHHLVLQVSFPLVLLLLNLWCTPPLRIQVSILCVTSLVQLFFLLKLLKAFLVLFTDTSLVLQLLSQWPQSLTSMTKHFIFHIR